MKKILVFGLFSLFVVFNHTLPADERILSFHSDITVHQDGSMTVHEHITVRAEGRKIRRGIYRDFPTTYKDHLGNRYKVGFEVIGVKRDGVPESYHTKSRSNGVRIYVGNKNYRLPRGQYAYTLSYRTNRQLGFFKKHDELYWNVTGNGWIFPIDSASATVKLPTVIPRGQIKTEAYTGRSGSKNQNYKAKINDVDGNAEFFTSRPLGSYEGLTIVVSWPKGFIAEPTTADKAKYLFQDNRHLIYMLIGLVIVFLYYLIVWWRFGRDLPTGTIIPLYYPAKGYSPAAMRFIRERHYDNQTFATALTNLAIKGYIEIDETDDNFKILLKENAPEVKLSAGEQDIMQQLFGIETSPFGARRKSIELDNKNHSVISSAITAHKKSLKRNYEKIYFVRNSGLLLPGILLTFATIAMIFFSDSVSVSTVIIGIIMVIMNIAFYYWLHADTRLGRRLMDKIDGFREYLSVAERDELKMRGAPRKTTDLFEMYLPYALALDVQQDWAERFASVFAELEQKGQGYQPGWYHGSHWHSHRLGSFANNLSGSLSSAISSSSTAPGSSSGGGGGGSSGGGGGGGGGGGW